MAVKSGNTSLDPRHLPLQNVMVECCMGLVTVDQESSSMRLVHYALQEFFRDQREEFFPREKTKLRRVALTTYLFLNDFVLGCCEAEAAIERLMKDFPLLRYASTNWGRHVQFSHCDRIYGLPLKLLYSPPCRALSLQIQHFSQRYRAESWKPDKVNSHNAFHCACNFGLQTAVCNILDSGDIDIDGATNIGTTALNWAASAGHVVLVKLLMSRGVDSMKANWYGTALHWAAEAGQCESISLLLNSGMEINLRDTFGRTPLHCASDRRHILAMELLLDKGADPNARDNAGNVLIHDAAQTGDERLMRRLLGDVRVHISATTIRKMTVLHCAAMGGHANIVRMLLDVGAETDARGDGGYTALHRATPSGSVGERRRRTDARRSRSRREC